MPSNSTTREIVVRVKSDLDPAGFKDLKAEAASVKDELNGTTLGFEHLEESVSLTDQVFERLATQSGALGEHLGQIKGEAKDAAGAIDDVGQSVKKTTDEIDDAKKKVSEYEKRLKGLRDEADVYGDVSSRFSSFAGLAGGLGAGGVSQAVMLGSDVTDAVEAVKLVGPALDELGTRAGKAAPLLGKAGSMLGNLLGIAPGIATLGVAVVGIGAAVGAAVAGFNALKGALEGADKATEAKIQALIVEGEQEKLLYELLRTGTVKGLQAEISAREYVFQKDIEIRDGMIASVEEQVAGYSYAESKFRGLAASLGASTDDMISGSVDDIRDWNEELGKQERALDAYRQAFDLVEVAEEMERTTGAALRLYEISEQYTTEQIEKELRYRELQREALEAGIAEVEGWIAEFEGKGELTGEEETALSYYFGLIADKNQQLVDLGHEIEDLELAAPLVEESEKQAAAVTALVEQYEREMSAIDMLNNASSMTVDQIDERLDAIKDERRVIMDLLPQLKDLAGESDEAAQQLAQFEDVLSDLDFEADTLRAIKPDALAAQMKEAWGEGVKAFGEYQAELVELEAQAAEDRLDIAEAAAEQDAKIREKAADDLAKLEKETAADRLASIKDAASEERKLRRRQELEDRYEYKRHLETLGDLALARDVDAYIEAQEDRTLDLEQQRAERDLEALERQEALDEELAQIRENADAKTEAIREGGEKELATLQENEAKQLSALDERLEKEYAAREEAFVKQIDALTDSLDRQEDEAIKGYGALEDEFAGYLAGMGGDLAAFGLDAKAALANLSTGLTGGAFSSATKALEGRVSTSGGSNLAGATIQFNNTIENPTFGQLETYATANQRFAAFQQEQAYLWARNAQALNSLLVR
jgi:hypothetical protein